MAVAVPDMEEVKAWAQKRNIYDDSADDLCRNQTLRDDVIKAFSSVAKQARLYNFETVRSIILSFSRLLFASFTADNTQSKHCSAQISTNSKNKYEALA